MKTLVFALLLFFANFAVAQEEKCAYTSGPTYYQRGYVLVEKEVPAFRHMELWGASDHSPHEFVMADTKFRFHWIETRHPKIRYIHNVRHGTLVFKCGSNDDTGKDHIRVMAGGEILLDKDFGEKDTFSLKVNFSSATTVIVMVYNNCMPNSSPGAFFVGINMKYNRTIFVRQKALIAIKL